MKVKVCLAAGVLVLSSFAAIAETAQEKAEMAKMVKAATPGAEHQKLAGMVVGFESLLKPHAIVDCATSQTL